MTDPSAAPTTDATAVDDGTHDVEQPARSVLAPLRRQRVRRMVGAQFLAETGDGVTLVALPLYVYERTGSELLTSITFAAEMGVGAIGAIAGGVLADTFDRQRVLLTSYLVRAALLTAAFAIDPLLAAVSLGVLARAGGQADNPSFDALIPTQARGDLQQLLALRRLIQGVSISVGPAVGAFIVAALGPRTGIAVNAGLFLVSFVILRTVTGLDTDVTARRSARSGRTTRQALGDLARGARTILAAPGLSRLVIYLAATMATIGVAHAAAVVWFERDVQRGGHWFGISVAAYGIGTVVGLYLAGRRRFTWPLPRILVASAPVYAAMCAIGVAVDIAWLLPASWLVWGIALGPEMVRGEVFIVHSVPPAGRGRAYASIGVAITIGFAIGYAISGPLLETYPARTVLLALAAVILAIGAMWVAPAVRNEPHWNTDRPGHSTADIRSDGTYG